MKEKSETEQQFLPFWEVAVRIAFQPEKTIHYQGLAPDALGEYQAFRFLCAFKSPFCRRLRLVGLWTFERIAARKEWSFIIGEIPWVTGIHIRLFFSFFNFAVAVSIYRAVLDSNYRAHSFPSTDTGGVGAWVLRRLFLYFFSKLIPYRLFNTAFVLYCRKLRKASPTQLVW